MRIGGVRRVAVSDIAGCVIEHQPRVRNLRRSSWTDPVNGRAPVAPQTPGQTAPLVKRAVQAVGDSPRTDEETILTAEAEGLQNAAEDVPQRMRRGLARI